MKPLKFGLIALVVLLAITVAYGYGCGGDDDSNGGAGSTSAAEADGSSSNAANTEESGDGDGAAEDGGGDGKGDGGGDGAPLSKASYIKQGDLICEKVPQTYAQTVTSMEEKNGSKTPSAAEVNLKAAVPPLYTAIEEFEDLGVPSGDEQQIEALLEALEDAAKGLEAKPTSELTGPKSPFAEFQKLSREYDFQFCDQL